MRLRDKIICNLVAVIGGWSMTVAFCNVVKLITH